MKKYLTTKEASKALNRADQTLRKWACSGEGPIKPIHIHGRLAWPADEIEKILQGGTGGQESPVVPVYSPSNTNEEMISPSQMSRKLGLEVTGDFIEHALGVPCKQALSRRRLWFASDWNLICQKLCQHIESKMSE